MAKCTVSHCQKYDPLKRHNCDLGISDPDMCKIFVYSQLIDGVRLYEYMTPNEIRFCIRMLNMEE